MISPEMMKALALAGGYAAVGLAAVGSGLGAGTAGAAAIGAWKKCYAANKPAPFLLMAYAGAPLSQTIYGMILLILIKGKVVPAADAGTEALAQTALALQSWPLFLVIGILGGIGMGVSAWYQGRAGAGACDAFAETGKGFANNIMVLGIIETVAIFTLVFALLAI